MNLFTIDGEISKLPQYGKSANGVSVVKFSIVQNKNFYSFVAFREVADKINEMNLGLKDVVSIESKITQNNYEKNGQKVYGYNFIVEKITIEEKAPEKPNLDDDIPYNDEPAYKNTTYLD